MNAHHFLEGIKVNRFCLTLVEEARLWYKSLQPISIDWQGLQNLFRQQYLKYRQHKGTDKIDKLTAIMGKLVARDKGTNRQFKPQIYQSRRRGQSINFYDSIIMIEEIVKSDTDQIVVTGEISIDKVEVDPGMNKIIGEEILEAMRDLTNISEDKIVEENTEVIIGMEVIAEKEVGVGLGKDHFQGKTIIVEGMIEA